ncbi:MAG: hypothetical protein JSS30_00575 [Verrucomicrobia bacterium]|nr:hypothetical protein [Verrucomicrobiota bacterium]
MNKILPFLLLLSLLAGCRAQKEDGNTIVSMQTVDRNGFSETISTKDRLAVYQNVNFLTSQPYEKVMRVYKKDQEGKSHAKLTSYHPNGGIWQYLEVVDNRANGHYYQWHENGRPMIEGTIIEGMADLSELAQQSWLFDKECKVWDEEGNLQALFTYEKGLIAKEAVYYFPSGKVAKIIPYKKGLIDGVLTSYDEEGSILQQIPFKAGVKDGAAIDSWIYGIKKSDELYQNGLLIEAAYYDPQGNLVAEVKEGYGTKAQFDGNNLFSLTQYQNGVVNGEVKEFDPNGKLHCCYRISDGKKNGEEFEYFPDGKSAKLMVTWAQDQIQGMVKTWYKNGIVESQREMTGNKKHGICLGYYSSGDPMLMEEYENDRLIKGSYFKKGEKHPVSTIENGDGVATLYTSEGQLLKKVNYEKSKPVLD